MTKYLVISCTLLTMFSATAQQTHVTITPQNFEQLTLVQTLTGDGNTSAASAINEHWWALGEGYPSRSVRVWASNANHPSQIIDPRYTTPEGRTNTLALHQDILAIGGSVGEGIHLWNLDTQAFIGTIDEFAYDMTFTNTGDLVVAALQSIVVYGVKDATIVEKARIDSLTYWRIYTTDVFAAIPQDRTVHLIPTLGDTIYNFDEQNVYDLILTDDELIYVLCRIPLNRGACAHQKIVFQSLDVFERRGAIDVLQYETNVARPAQSSLALSDDGSLLVLHWGTRLYGFDTATLDSVGEIETVTGAGVTFTDNGSALVLRGAYSELQIWRVVE